jgi:hypothetical protein
MRVVMKRKTSFTAALGLISAFVPLISAQGVQSRPSPILPPDVVGPQLIAWSQVQKPQPVPQPLPNSDRPRTEREQHPAQTADQSNQPKPTAQTAAAHIETAGSK